MESIEFSNGAKAYETELKGCYIINPRFFGDERGYYVADYIKEDMEELGFRGTYEHKEEKSKKNVLRRMELNVDNTEGNRIVRAVTGDAIDIIIDAREDSPTYGKYTLVHLTPYKKSDELSGKEVLVPAGFVHGVLSLKDGTHVQETREKKVSKDKVSTFDEEKITVLFNNVLTELGANLDEITICKNKEVSKNVKTIPTGLEDCYVVEPNYVVDEGGYQVCDYQDEEMKRLGFEKVYQHSESKSAKNVLRGMHFQLDPKCQAKLVRVVKGEVIDIVVDIREGSPTYGKSYAIHLKPYDLSDPTSGRQLYVPRGFAHGFISLTDDAIFQYFVDNSYAPALEEGILWSGEETRALFESILEEHNIRLEDLIISEKDQHRLALKDKPKYFKYNGKNKPIEYSFEVGV